MHLRLLKQSHEVLGKARRRHRNARWRPRHTPLRGEDVEGTHQLVDIVQRLTHTHKDDVGQPVALGDGYNLIDDLRCRQLMAETHTPRGAEFTPHTASRLRRHTERHTLTIGDKRRLDILTLRRAEEILLRAIGRGGDLKGRGETYNTRLLKLLARKLRQVSHRINVGDEARVEPPRNLLRGKARQLQTLAESLQFGKRSTIKCGLYTIIHTN